jgi:hypothetical protein
LKLTGLLEALRVSDRITPEQHAEVLAYLKQT